MVRIVDKVETYQKGSNKQIFNFSKTVDRVSPENRNTSKSGRESRDSRNVSNGVEQTNYNFSKIVGRVIQENRNISKRGQTNIFLKQIFQSGKSIKSKRIKRGRTNKFSVFQKLSAE